MKDSKNGFTLIEILLVISLLVVMATLTTIYGIGNFKKSQFRKERDLVLGVLHQARSKSMANINQSGYGVHIESSKYVLFLGDIYDSSATTNVEFQAKTTISHSGMTEVAFEPLSGDATVTGGDLTLSDGESQSVISINNVGKIDWQN